MAQQIATERTCPECSGDVTPEGDEFVCSDCGIVVDEDRLDHGPEWRSFPGEGTNNNTRRCSAVRTVSRHDRGLGTVMGYGNDSARTERMRRENRRGKMGTTSSQNLVYGLGEIRRMTSTLDLGNSVRDRASYLFRKAQDAQELQGRSLEGFATAALYATCRERSLGVTMDHLVETARCSKSDLKTCYSVLNRIVGVQAGPASPVEYLGRIAEAVDAGDDVQRRATQYAKVISERDAHVGRKPSGVAAACLYRAGVRCGADLTQTEIADAADVSCVTLRSGRNLLDDHLSD
jgi:transcription initiation factor TFIIB